MNILDIIALPHVQLMASSTDKLMRLRTTDSAYLISNYKQDMDMEDYFAADDVYLPVHDEYYDLCVITREEDEQHRAEIERIVAGKPIEE